ncbi:MAG: hypothetical protein AAF514_14490, partial [Verrucomicrobiota bacterium]
MISGLAGQAAPRAARGVSENYESITSSIEHVRGRMEEVRLVGGDLNHNFDGDASGELYTSILADFGDGTVSIGETYYAHTRIDHVFHYPNGWVGVRPPIAQVSGDAAAQSALEEVSAELQAARQ